MVRYLLDVWVTLFQGPGAKDKRRKGSDDNSKMENMVGREQPVGNHLNVIHTAGPPSTELGIHCRGLLAQHIRRAHCKFQPRGGNHDESVAGETARGGLVCCTAVASGPAQLFDAKR